MATPRTIHGGIGICLAVTLGVFLPGAGCGLGLVDDQSGGADHLPTQGAGPYGKPGVNVDTPANEPYVISVFRVHVRDPSALWRADGGFRLWFGYEADLQGRESAIWYAELADITELPDVAPRPALEADQPWEQGWIGAPSVVELPGGELVMLYQGGLDAVAIGRADSHDGGLTWEKHALNPLIQGYAEPGLGFDEEIGWVLFATRPDQQGIYRADSADGMTWTFAGEAVLMPRPERADAYDRYKISDPAVVIRRTRAGRLHYGMFFNGTNQAGTEAITSVGWAGSFDSMQWSRFSSPDEPVLAEPGTTSEHGPTALLESDRGYLFFHEERQGVQRITVAVHP